MWCLLVGGKDWGTSTSVVNETDVCSKLLTSFTPIQTLGITDIESYTNWILVRLNTEVSVLHNPSKYDPGTFDL